MSVKDLPLDALQNWMQEALVFPRRTSPEETEQIVEASPRLAAPDRLAIYQRSYTLRLVRCMEEQFPALCHALGKELFDSFAGEYLRACPSISYTLHELGRRFPGYLEETRPDKAEPGETREEWIDFMVDLANYEWELISMFDAEGQEGRPFAVSGTPDIRLKLQPCFKIHRSRFQVAWYYHEVRQENDPPFPEKRDSFLAMARKDYVTRTHPLSKIHYRFLEELRRGATIDQAVEIVAGETGKTVDSVKETWRKPGGLREHWLGAGFFIDAESERDLE